MPEGGEGTVESGGASAAITDADETLPGRGGAGSAPEPRLERGQLVGRYVILSRLGAGARRARLW